MNGFVSVVFKERGSNRNQNSSNAMTILNKIAKVNNVIFAYLVTGPVDVMAWVQAPDSNAFRDTLLGINSVSGVDRTSTNVAL